MATDRLINQSQGDDIIDALDDIATSLGNISYGEQTSSDKVVAMTGYQKASTAEAITQADTLNEAVGKLEKKVDDNATDISDKVDKVTGKGLSSNDYTDDEKNKLSNIQAGAEVNVQADWSQTTSTADSYIKNKPTLGTAAAANTTDFATAAQGTKADNAIPSSTKGVANGVASLDANGKVPSSQLPSYVDDVLEYSSKSSFPSSGESGKIYVDTTTNKTYRWGGSAYVEISESLALGETENTAYYGDKGKTAYDHSQVTSGNPHNVTKTDVGLGNVGNFKAVSTVASQGLSDTEKSNARANIGAGTGNGTYSKPSGGIPKTDLASAVQTSLGLADTSLQHTTVSGSPDLDTYLTTGVYHITTQTATHAPTTNHATLFVDATVGAPYQVFKPDTGDTVWYTRHRSGSAWTAWVAMKLTDTTYSDATTSAAGLMSAADKTKLNGIAAGAQVNSITGVKGNSESTYRTGNVNITAANIGLGNVGNFKAVSTVASQGLSSTEQANARANIGAGTSSLTIGTTSTTAAAGNHTHNYAGSSSAGGAATSANKLNTNAGSATQPVYFSNGVPVATTYTLGKSVPSDAKFTDTVYTHPTTAGNKHIPSGGSTGQILVYGGSSGTAAWGSVPCSTIVASNIFESIGSTTYIDDNLSSLYIQGKHLFGTLMVEFNASSTQVASIKSDYLPVDISTSYQTGMAFIERYSNQWMGSMWSLTSSDDYIILKGSTVSAGFRAMLRIDYLIA